MKLDERRKMRGEYFTADWLSQTLVSQLETKIPDSFVDLGSGRGSLLKAVRGRWAGLDGLSVEIDQLNIEYLRREFPEIKHLNLDIIDLEFPKKFIGSGGKRDSNLIVCNPPYKNVKLGMEIRKILKYVGADKSLGTRKSINSEILFLIQALKIFPMGSEMAVIVPDYIITAERCKAIRQILVDYFGVYKIIEVEHKVFAATDVKTHLVFLRLGISSTNKIDLLSASDNAKKKIEISNEEFLSRGDYNFFNTIGSLEKNLDTILLGDVSKIIRGNLPMHVASSSKLIPFHTTDFKSFDGVISEEDSLNFTQSKEYNLANKNDILLARVGRNASRQAILVESGILNISDCIFAISINDCLGINSSFVLREISSQRGQAWLRGKSKGSGAKSISLKNLLEFPIIFKELD